MLNYNPTLPKSNHCLAFLLPITIKSNSLLEFQGPSDLVHTSHLLSCHCPAQSLSFSAALAFFLFLEHQSHFLRAVALFVLSAWNARFTLQDWLRLLDIYSVPWPNVPPSKRSFPTTVSTATPSPSLITWTFYFSSYSETGSLFIHLPSARLPGKRASSTAAGTLLMFFKAPRAAPRNGPGTEGWLTPYVWTQWPHLH